MADFVGTLASSLATFGATVSGVTRSFDVNQIPAKIIRGYLPCLIIVPEDKDAGHKALAFLGFSPSVQVSMLHIMLVAESGVDGNVKGDLPGVNTLESAYYNAAATQRLLTYSASPAQQVVMEFSKEKGITEYAGIEYHSLIFHHVYTCYL